MLYVKMCSNNEIYKYVLKMLRFFVFCIYIAMCDVYFSLFLFYY
jgi:hypothetical protein